MLQGIACSRSPRNVLHSPIASYSTYDVSANYDAGEGYVQNNSQKEKLTDILRWIPRLIPADRQVQVRRSERGQDHFDMEFCSSKVWIYESSDEEYLSANEMLEGITPRSGTRHDKRWSLVSQTTKDQCGLLSWPAHLSSKLNWMCSHLKLAM